MSDSTKCLSPTVMYQARFDRDAPGEVKLTLDPRKALDSNILIDVRCGHCSGCTNARIRELGIRGMHERLMRKHSVMITLTYNEDNVPLTAEGRETLRRADFTKFVKRLRKAVAGNGKSNLLVVSVGEYGERTLRPHGHFDVFGDCEIERLFEGKVAERAGSKSGLTQFSSPLLSDLWPFGFATFGELTEGGIMYGALHLSKQDIYPRDSEGKPFAGMELPYMQLPQKPALGDSYYAKHGDAAAERGYYVWNGLKHRLSRRHMEVLKDSNRDLWRDVKAKRLIHGKAKALSRDAGYRELSPRREALHEFNMLALTRGRRGGV